MPDLNRKYVSIIKNEKQIFSMKNLYQSSPIIFPNMAPTKYSFIEELEPIVYGQ